METAPGLRRRTNDQRGVDSVFINTAWKDFTILAVDGSVLYRYGTRGTASTIFNLEMVTVLDANGNMVYSKAF